MNTFDIRKGCFLVYYNHTASFLYVDEHRDFSRLEEPENLYQACKNLGFDQEKTIDTMLEHLHTKRIIKGGLLGDISVCVALIGPRGSGKSVGMTGIAVLDGLLARRRVVSNLPIAVKVRYRDCEKVFRTESLDAAMMLDENEFSDNYFDCLILVDEVNTYLADSQRTMSNQALSFAYILQQMRHRKLDFIFTTQAEGWNTNRTRFQTDFYIQCRDMALMGGNPDRKTIGRRSHWRLHDMSGMVTGDVLKMDTRTFAVPPYATREFWNTPFWNCYDTAQMQERKKYTPGKNGEGMQFDKDHLEELQKHFEVPVDLLSKLIGLDLVRIKKSALWEKLGIADDAGMKVKMGKALTDLGCKTIASTNGRDYILPSQAEMIKSLKDMGLELN